MQGAGENIERASSRRKKWLIVAACAVAGALLTLGVLIGASRESLVLRASVLALGFALATLLAVLIWNVIAIKNQLGRLVDAGRSIEDAIRESKWQAPQDPAPFERTAESQGSQSREDLTTTPVVIEERSQGSVDESDRVEIPQDEDILKAATEIDKEPRKAVSALRQSVREVVNSLQKSSIATRTVELKNLRPGILEASANGRLLLIDRNDGGRCEVIPAFERVQIGDEIRNYDEFFECANPKGGQVWIEEPALVAPLEIPGEWELQKKGRLVVR